MPKSAHLITDFTGGEVSPRLDTRADIDRYERSCREIENWVVAQQGGLLMRRGTEYVGDSIANGADPSPEVTLIEWRGGAGDEPDILFEIVGSIMRGWTKDGQVMSGGSPYQITLPGLEFVSLGAEVQYAQRGNLLVICSKVGPPVLVRVLATDDWEVSLVPVTSFPTRRFFDAVARPVTDSQFRITFSGFNNGDLFRVFFSQFPGNILSSDFGGQLGQLVLNATYSSTAATTAANIRQILEVVYPPESFSVTVVSATAYDLTITGFLRPTFGAADQSGARAISTSNITDGFIGNELAWSYPTVVTYDPGSGVKYYRCIKAHVSETGGANTPNMRTDLWVELDSAPEWEAVQPSLAWSSASFPYGLGDRGFPTAVTFHEQRLILAGTKSAPATLWGSAIGDPTNFSLGVEANQAWSIDLDAATPPYIRWMTSNNGLWVGTTAGTWRLTANITLSPTDIQAERFSGDRCDRRAPEVVGNEVFFVPQGLRQLRAIRYNNEYGPYETIELSALAEHLGRCRIRRIIYCQQPQPVVYLLVNTPGRVVAVSYNRQGDLLAFSRLELDAHIVDIGTTFDPHDGDVLWLVIKRGTAVALERMPYPVTISPCASLDLTTTKHLDGWVRRTAVSGEVSGLTHLLGKTVTVLNSDGSFQKTATVVQDSNPPFDPVTVPNADFSSGLTNWNTVAGSVSVVSGECRLESSALLGLAWVQSDPIAVTPGRRYRASVKYRTNVPGAAFNAPFLIRLFNAGGGVLSLIFEDQPETATQQTVTVEFVAPAGSATVRLGSYVTSGGFQIRAMFVDDFSLEAQSTEVFGVIAATGQNLIIGQPFSAKAVTMEPVVGNPSGPSMGNRKRWGDLSVKIYESALPLVNGDRPSDYSQGDPRATPHLLRSGRFRVNDLGWKDGAVTVEQDLPYQTQVIGLYGDLSTGTGG